MATSRQLNPGEVKGIKMERGSGQAPPPRRFTRLELENWCNFRRVQVALPARVFLVGPNASGKSNLLDVFRFLRDIVAVGGSFQEAVDRRGGVSQLRCFACRRKENIRVAVTLGDSRGKPLWDYSLSFNEHRGRPVVTKEKVALRGNVILERPNEADERDPEQLAQTHLEHVIPNARFREVASFFAGVSYWHVVPQFVRDTGRAAAPAMSSYGADFAAQVAGTSGQLLKERMSSINSALKAAIPQLEEISLRTDERGRAHLVERYRHWRPGQWQTDSRFSDGILRLVGLLWALLEGRGPLLLEEPEMSLHPGTMRFIPQMMARLQGQKPRQIILSTHSTDLLGDSGIGLEETLLLVPGDKGTRVEPASQDGQARALLEGGASIADAVVPLTSPEGAGQLPFCVPAAGADSGVESPDRRESDETEKRAMRSARG